MAEQRNIKSLLIHFAGDLAMGKLLPKIDTDHWYVSTPLAERRQITAAMDAAHERHKELAVRLRAVADSL